MVLLVAGTAGLAVSNLLMNRQKARAEANFQLARAAVDDMYTQVAEKWLAQESHMVPLQREFLLKALAVLRAFCPAGRFLGRGASGGGQGRGRVGEIQ